MNYCLRYLAKIVVEENKYVILLRNLATIQIQLYQLYDILGP